MKKIMTLLLAIIAVFSARSFAQPGTACNANFSFIINGTTNNVEFTPANLNTSALLQHDWLFGDGYFSNLYNPSHVYTYPGVYSVVHVVTYRSPNDSTIVACIDSSIQLITIANTAPCNLHADFFTSTNSLYPGSVGFNNTSTGVTPETAYRWDFGDGTFSAPGEYSTTHTYLLSGDYTVCFSIRRDSLCAADTCKVIHVEAPVTTCNQQAYFTSQPDSSNDLLVHFFNQSISLLATDSITWIFGDGTTAPGMEASHNYAQPGTYNVCLVVKRVTADTIPCVREFCQTITLPGNPPPPPACNIHSNFSFVRDSIQTNKVYFSNLSTGTTPNTIIKWYFGDGTFSYDTNPVHIYQTSGAYTVCLAVKRDSLCADDTCKIVQVQAPNTCNLQVSFSSQADSSNHLLVHFYNHSTPLASTDSITWVFGDGSISHDVNASHTYFQGGTYNVCLVVKKSTPGAVPCVREFCQTIILAGPPPPVCNIHASFGFVRDSIQTNKVYFTNLSNDTVPWNTTRWGFGDGTYSSDINPVHTYQTSGAYTVCLSIRRDSLCADDTCMIVQVQAPNNCNLQPYFNSQADSSNHLLLHFFNQTAGLLSSDSIVWKFGDGSISYDVNPSHTYAQAGTYNVCFVVGRNIPGAAPCIREYCKTITVQASTACNLVANFNFRRDSIPGTALNTYVFENTSTPLNNTDSSFWDFGDSTAVVINPNNPVTHTYTHTGVYIVCLKVKKVLAGSISTVCERQICQTIVVTAPPANCSLAVNFNWHSDSSNQRKIYFTNLTNGQPAAAVATWTFGDGTSGSSWSPDHIYAQAGQYTVCLKVSINGTTCTSDTCKLISIQGNPQDSCTIRPGFVNSVDSSNRRKIYFTNTTAAAASATYAAWTFGDGTAHAGWNADHIYAMPGWYMVCLTVRTQNNCTVTHCDSVFVPGNVIPPVNCDSFQLDFGYRTDDYMPNKLFFFATSNAPVYNQYWTFTKANDTTAAVGLYQNNPVYVFPDTGVYNVCVRAAFSTGCIKEYCDNVHIYSTSVPSQCVVNSYPNPAHDHVSFNVQLDAAGPILSTVYNISGTPLLQYTQQGLAGNNLITLNVQNLTTGFYTVKIMYGGRICYTRFQKI